MSSRQESKIPFIILIPFLIVVFVLAMSAGVPTAPSMPGVLIPLAPVVRAPEPVVAPVKGESTEPAAPATTEQTSPVTPAQENWN